MVIRDGVDNRDGVEGVGGMTFARQLIQRFGLRALSFTATKFGAVGCCLRLFIGTNALFAGASEIDDICGHGRGLAEAFGGRHFSRTETRLQVSPSIGL